jgi:succinate-acetate transporter protein
MSHVEPQSSSALTPAHSIADPAPLGLSAFAMTTVVLSVYNAHFLGAATEAVVLPLALFYGGLTQLLAGMWEFKRGNTFGATAFCSFGAFWLAYYLLAKDIAPTLATSPDANKAVGVFLLVWAIFTAYMAVASIRVSGAVLGVFVALTATFIVLSIANFDTSTTLTKVGGWLGLVTAAFAWYASFAGVVASTFRRDVVPTFPSAPRA